ncbi:hypothetical protein Tco_0993262 [Tanacetum coccineum]|uniref:Uncharacterized protein n=1 Tax=Tanacetum coccineum TaxID=301880 RepID=A0ABQ5F549_9ASTR
MTPLAIVLDEDCALPKTYLHPLMGYGLKNLRRSLVGPLTWWRTRYEEELLLYGFIRKRMKNLEIGECCMQLVSEVPDTVFENEGDKKSVNDFEEEKITKTMEIFLTFHTQRNYRFDEFFLSLNILNGLAHNGKKDWGKGVMCERTKVFVLNGIDLMIIAVYAPHDPRDKRMLWDYLAHVINQWQGEVILYPITDRFFFESRPMIMVRFPSDSFNIGFISRALMISSLHLEFALLLILIGSLRNLAGSELKRLYAVIEKGKCLEVEAGKKKGGVGCSSYIDHIHSWICSKAKIKWFIEGD